MKKIIYTLSFVVFASFFSLFFTGCNEHANNPPPNAPIAQQINFVGDNSTRVYHYPACKKCPHESNVVPFDSPLSATRSGFKPCKKCHPPSQ